MKIRPLYFLVIVILVLSTACSVAGEPSRSESAAFDAGAPEFAAEEEAFDGDFVANATGDSLEDISLQSQDGPERLIIRNGEMTVVVDDTEASAREIAQLAKALNGWTVDSSLYESNGYKRGSVTIRVPADQFDAAVAEIKAMALEVQSESTSSRDVTEEYVDLESRLTNLEATADRVRGFLDEARNVEDALDVNRELSNLESEIEVIKGRMKYLSQLAAFSMLTVTLVPDEVSQPVEIGGWRPEGVAKDAVEALASTLQAVGTAAIWGGIFCLPLALLVGVPLFFIGRTVYRRRQRGRDADNVASERAGAESAGHEEQ